ncbi:hypothetical protein EGK74_08670 [Neisseria weixii]|uniref:Uncharacterized protein n=2 Tax=Neisseria weixii TaxID=1853276 RepID=A0A3N4MR20_9NEIS|nr:hypothetical protein EGK74_08670 [Neisseria weixii]
MKQVQEIKCKKLEKNFNKTFRKDLEMWLDKKKIIPTFMVIFIIFCFYIVFLYTQKKYNEDDLIENYKKNKISIEINTLTNFQWDYVDFFVTNADLQKVTFYQNEDIIFEKKKNFY